jgi:hypothetical protein
VDVVQFNLLLINLIAVCMILTVPNVPANISCNKGISTGTDCSAFPGSIYVPISPEQYVSTGACMMSIGVGSAPSCCYSRGILIIQSIDLCDLAIGALENLSPSSINMFGGGC